MQRYNLSKKLFDLEEDSESSVDSVIYISSDSENEVSSSWDSDWSTDTEEIIERIEREVKAAPIPIARRGMTTEDLDDEMTAGPSSAWPVPPSTPKLGFEYFNKEMCLAPSKKQRKSKVELCATVLPVLESPQSPPDHERGPSIDTPLAQSTSGSFYASYHVQNIEPYQDVSQNLHTGCMVCGKSRDQIKAEKVNWYMQRSTPSSEPAYITAQRREAYENGLNAGSLLFLTPAVSQAAACDGTRITTTAEGQEIAAGTLPIY